MQKTLVALSLVAAFVVTGLAGSASAAPVQTGTSLTASHSALTTVKTTKKATKKTGKKTAKKKTK
jgi:hypothetical protein